MRTFSKKGYKWYGPGRKCRPPRSVIQKWKEKPCENGLTVDLLLEKGCTRVRLFVLAAPGSSVSHRYIALQTENNNLASRTVKTGPEVTSDVEGVIRATVASENGDRKR